MNNNFVLNEFLPAIDTVIQQRLSQLPISQTFVGDIVGNDSYQKHVYRVKYGGLLFNALAEEGKKYNIGDKVYIHVPDGNYNNDKIIIGKFVRALAGSVEEQAADNHEIIIEKIINFDVDLELYTQDQNNSVEVILPFANNLLPKEEYDYLQIRAYYNVDCGDSCAQGEYETKISFSRDNIPISMEEEYVLKSEDFYTPYMLLPNCGISKTFKFSKYFLLNNINNLKVTLTKTQSFPDNLSQSTIGLKRIELCYGYNISNYDNNIYIQPLENINDQYYNYTTTILPNLETILLDLSNQTIISELTEYDVLRWYLQRPNEPGDNYGGAGWLFLKETDQTFISDISCQHDTNEMIIKCVWCKRIDNNYTVVGTSDPIKFINSYSYLVNGGINREFIITGAEKLLVYDDNSLAIGLSSLYDYNLEKISSENIEIQKIQWEIIGEGLIKGFRDNEDVVKNQIIYNNDSNISITIVPRIEYNKTNSKPHCNIIRCIVNDTYISEKYIEFGQMNTQGTNYVFNIVPIDQKYLRNEIAATQRFGAELFLSDGSQITIPPENITWSWKQWDTYSFDEDDVSGNYYIQVEDELILPEENRIRYDEVFNQQKEYISLTQEGTQAVLTLNKPFDSSYMDAVIEKTYVDNDPTKELLDWTIVSQDRAPNTHILSAKCKVEVLYDHNNTAGIRRVIELEATYPISVVSVIDPKIINNIEVNGIFDLNWNNEGELISFGAGDLGPDGLVDTTPYFVSHQPNAFWRLAARNPEVRNDYTISQGLDQKYYLQLNQKLSFCSDKVSIVAVDNTGKVYYSQPLEFRMDKYSIDMTNKWAGGVVSIDEEDATIMATAMGAGHKNSDNSFTGVLMGDVQLNQQSAIDSGLFGFNEGKMVFKLNKDAEFYVGSDNNNYISFKDKFFDLKTQTLKLNALADNFIIDSTGTSPAKFEYQVASDEEGDANVITKTIEVDNAVIAAHNNFIVTADGRIYAKNVCGFETTSNAPMVLPSTVKINSNAAGMVEFSFEKVGEDLKKVQDDLNNFSPDWDEIAPDLENKIEEAINAFGNETVSSWVAIKDNMVDSIEVEGQPTQYELNIKGGKIGSWSIDENYLYASHQIEVNGESQETVTALIGANMPIQQSDFVNLENKDPKYWYLWFKGHDSNSAFGVDKDGTLYAKNGKFKGKIEATEGTIGGWTIGSITYAPSSVPEFYREAIYHIMSAANGISGYDTFICGDGTTGVKSGQNLSISSNEEMSSPNGTSWRLWFGGLDNAQEKIEGKFGVTSEGIMYAKDAVIAGSIVATAGRIGGFNIGEVGGANIQLEYKPHCIYTRSEEGKVTSVITGEGIPLSSGIQMPQNEKWQLWFADEEGVGRFGVTNRGTLVAENAILNGNIVATGGQIGGFNIGNGEGNTPDAIYTLAGGDIDDPQRPATLIFSGVGVTGKTITDLPANVIPSGDEVWKFWIGEENQNDHTVQGRFGISSKGILYASKVHIGKGSTIGDWQVSGDDSGGAHYLSGYSETGQINLSTGLAVLSNNISPDGITNSPERWTIWVGTKISETDQYSSYRGYFGVTNKGALYATEGKIAGWSIAPQAEGNGSSYQSGLYYNFNQNEQIRNTADEIQIGLKIPKKGEVFDTFKNNYFLYVTQNAQAQAAADRTNIFGITYDGRIQMKGLDKVRTFTLGAGFTNTDNKLANIGTTWVAYLAGNEMDSNDFVDEETSQGSTTSTGAFGIRRDGKVFSTAGKIGSWTLSSNCLYTKRTNPVGGYYYGITMYGGSSSSGTALSFYRTDDAEKASTTTPTIGNGWTLMASIGKNGAIEGTSLEVRAKKGEDSVATISKAGAIWGSSLEATNTLKVKDFEIRGSASRRAIYNKFVENNTTYCLRIPLCPAYLSGGTIRYTNAMTLYQWMGNASPTELPQESSNNADDNAASGSDLWKPIKTVKWS